jgi:hypothetical protein
LVAGVLAAGVAGCGSGGVSRAPVAAKTIGGFTLAERLLKPSRLPGFALLGPATVTASARNWGADRGQVDPQLAAQTARLDRLGFTAAAQETFARRIIGPGEGSGGAEVNSLVEELGSADAARSALNYWVAQARRRWQMPGGKWARFRVPEIPGAVGYDTAGPDATGHAVAFALGRFLYVVASSAGSGNRFVPSRRRVVSSATALYQRMRAEPRGES